MTSSTASVHSDKDHNEEEVEVDEYADAEKNYQPKTLKFWSIMIGLYMSIFLIALDRTIIATAIPKITDEFHSIEDISWYGSSYMLTCACFMPISGRVYQVFSTKWVFLICIAIFEIGSAICGAAPSSIVFIIGRAIAGLGSAGVFSGGTMVILPLVPLRKRPVFTSLFGLAFGISSVIGPLFGGTFTDQVTWRWCFYLNLPIGGFTFLVILLFFNVPNHTTSANTTLTSTKPATMSSKLLALDPLGTLFIVGATTSLILALQWGGTTHPWSSGITIGLLVTSAILFALFFINEYFTPTTAMAPLRVIKNRSIWGSMLFMFLLSGGMMSIIYYITLWFQAILSTSAMRAGIDTIPLLLTLILTGILSAVFTQKIGYYVPAMLLSPVLSAVGAGMLSTLTPQSGKSEWIGYQILYAFGLGAGFQNANLASQTVLPRVDVPIGIALQFFMQQLGGAVFLAISQSVFQTSLVHGLKGVEGIDVNALVNAGATGLKSLVSGEELERVLVVYNGALTKVFLVIAGVSAGMILGSGVVEWKSVKGKGVKGKKVDVEDGTVKGGEGSGNEKIEPGEVTEKTV